MAPAYSTIPTLTDGVVTLRAPIASDVMGSFEQCQDPQSQQWTTIPVPYTLDDANIYIHHSIPRGWETGKEWNFVVAAEDDAGARRFCGTISLRNLGERRAELAFGSHPWARGRGLMERAVRLLIEWGFAAQHLNTIEWLAPRGNWPSWRLAWKLGFSYEGVLPNWLSQRGELMDAWVGVLRRGEELSPRTPWLESPTLVGPSVTLRKLEPRDLPKIVETRADQDTQHWLQSVRETAPHTMETDATFVVERLEDAASGRAVHWAVTDNRTDLYVGQVSLFGLQYLREAELGFWAHPHWRRRGWSTEACRLVVKHSYIPLEDGGLGLRRLTADACATNEGSMRVLERSGFLRIGRTRQSTLRGDGKWMDTHIYDQLIADRDRDLW
jgi:RimJ/RimL family protein N-acetyltransferase